MDINGMITINEDGTLTVCDEDGNLHNVEPMSGGRLTVPPSNKTMFIYRIRLLLSVLR